MRMFRQFNLVDNLVLTNSSGVVHDENAFLASTCKGGDSIEGVATIGDFHDVHFKGVGVVASEDDKGFELVLAYGESTMRSS